ncbi:hypothetical protein [Kutzneria chonburiensis]|uniref:Uncharacterized protein n=1 Tax=Kutzneria chonburiensis TaxID=1483604 RepID=A0ABV6MK35_9PSEU|nr:hypothetical protein [Kutzneria chonburiensis]
MAATTTPALPLLAEIQQLATTRPGPLDPPVVVAAWYEAKAALLDRLADSTDPEAAGYAEQAIRAHQHAIDLRQGKGSR